MKTVLKPDGTIDNTDGLQPASLPLPDMSVLDSGLAPVPAHLVSSAATPQAATLVASAGALAPLKINATFGNTILNQVSTVADPTTALQIENAITAAVNFFQNAFTSNVPIAQAASISVNITISVSWPEKGVELSSLAFFTSTPSPNSHQALGQKPVAE